MGRKVVKPIGNRIKRKFCGNRHRPRATASSSTSGEGPDICSTPAPASVPKSASGRKLSYCMPTTPAESQSVYKQDSGETSFLGYRLFDLEILKAAIQENLACKQCGGDVVLNEVSLNGLGSKNNFQCLKCEQVAAFNSCRTLSKNASVFEVNRRTAYAMRCLGHGEVGLQTFCGVMDLPPPVGNSTYSLIVNRLLDASTSVVNASMSRAAEEEVDLANEDRPTDTDEVIRDVPISADGSWMTRGHTSHHGVCTVIGANSGKVLDIEVKSNHCKGCDAWTGKKKGTEYDAWLNAHSATCSANHSGSSGSMEVAGMIDIFHRSVKKHNIRYVEYIGDGDTKSYKSVVDSKPYGDDIQIRKIECVGHIQKRMGTRLRKLKSSLSGKKLSDGKSIGGKNRLTDGVILQLQKYYGNAIRTNSSSLKDLRMAVWAVFYHKYSTDDSPTHQFCPKGEQTWCPYVKAEAAGTVATYKHINNIPRAVMDVIKPIFKDLSDPTLLERCLGGRTQNANESLNSKIWKLCPKSTYSGNKIVNIAANDAVVTFNDGCVGRLHIMKALGLYVGTFAIAATAKRDEIRCDASEKRVLETTKEVRRTKRLRNVQENEKAVHKDGKVYEAGAF